MSRTLTELDREVARLAQEQTAHDGRDQSQFGLLRNDIVNMGKQLEAKIDTAVAGIQMQINPLIKDKTDSEGYARGVEDQKAKEEKRREPNKWVLAAWQGVATILIGAIIAWLARDHLQGGIGTGVQSVTTTSIASAPQHP